MVEINIWRGGGAYTSLLGWKNYIYFFLQASAGSFLDNEVKWSYHIIVLLYLWDQREVILWDIQHVCDSWQVLVVKDNTQQAL